MDCGRIIASASDGGTHGNSWTARKASSGALHGGRSAEVSHELIPIGRPSHLHKNCSTPRLTRIARICSTVTSAASMKGSASAIGSLSSHSSSTFSHSCISHSCISPNCFSPGSSCTHSIAPSFSASSSRSLPPSAHASRFNSPAVACTASTAAIVPAVAAPDRGRCGAGPRGCASRRKFFSFGRSLGLALMKDSERHCT
mmetsp:Transcript_37779/g.62541  ORF Transcript_37779/g.62541 Transcript_37779/m.62541 type:complete len:200 (-) Transcript_37779:99-698(-)